jgi:hypothetical protein
MHGVFKRRDTPISLVCEDAIEMPGLWLLEIALLKELPKLVESAPEVADQVWKTLAMIQQHLEMTKNPRFFSN